MSSDEEVVTRRQVAKIKPQSFLPKPRRVVTNDSPLTSTSTSVTQSPSGAVNLPKLRPKVYYDDEDDTFFTRKTTFSRKMNAKKSRKSEILRTLEDNPKLPTNSIEEERPKQKAKSKVKGKGKSSLLDWTTSDEPITLVDEEDDHIHFSDLSDDLEDRKKPIKNPDKNRRIDDKEDSLTPPPEINSYLLQSTLAPLHATLAQYSGSLRSDGNGLGSPIVSSALQDDIELEPELLAIQQSVRQEKNSNQSINTKVEILVSPKRHPGVLITDENANYDAPIKFIIMAEDTFESLITSLCSKKGINKQDLVLTYKNVRVFPRGTPSSLGMSGLVHMESYTKETYLYFKEQQELERKRLFEQLEEDSSSGQGIDIETNETNETNDNEIEMNEDKYLCLKFQCQDETIEKLKIKKSLTIQEVIDRYRIIKGVSKSREINLIFEDERLSPHEKLINTDLEDGDILSVKII
ncbi:uncharacterized protein OCT59_023138 [Rhizophagus irregularis]|uniref:Rad60/SUMO-like domain-containing protein n=2 Tax=Rhizophagus irregularis TaxID=588596 RepID=A0A015J0I4_RHIIW|nr:hypothetical protein GLOIN_2v1791125 [Rhizophagus irregularis DAOM 181602=DAOM 197198]EXX63047.1 hypothetical protein RirG_155980 [Rhizophagus irregularis DAOM 197198w]POG57904.1 hypothetical protein GLOIN_2v1791125 [Rhizophagus irregularis DAOM 181602=DAOM 197198]UZO29676.1 hypothetical protein OCT59_023138 [Rhizophagus irregularis]GBC35059.1 ubiquitin-2 like Rad60 SUMO-like-domain-containing protein [Rhizophagus irregularis DAOM 181602=DAOM 197198]|eukprot:XP_025164770.1 hypothetical protein GLOIN_2v1791125 [Rhizophagus irregularis DAOM 181602=DAOM 197198]